jgi:UDP:flavonoid glycosyltransferase YjiC (YdhE family)
VQCYPKVLLYPIIRGLKTLFRSMSCCYIRDVFITNGGYRGFQHSVSHGVPIIVAGMRADKPEVAARAEWAGFGLNLKTETPSQDTIREAVEEILADKKYKRRAQELQKGMEEYDTFSLVVENIEELASKQT